MMGGLVELDKLCISGSNGFFPTQGHKYILPSEKNSNGILVVATKSLKHSLYSLERV